jgi:hypothetical protein
MRMVKLNTSQLLDKATRFSMSKFIIFNKIDTVRFM